MKLIVGLRNRCRRRFALVSHDGPPDDLLTFGKESTVLLITREVRLQITKLQFGVK